MTKHVPHPYYAKLKRVLARAGDLYTVQDILDELAANTMQSFVEGESVAITRIALYPRCKVVEVLAVVGKVDEARVLHDRVLIFASAEVEANCSVIPGTIGGVTAGCTTHSGAAGKS